MSKRGPLPPSHQPEECWEPIKQRRRLFFFLFYYENKTNALGEGSMITRNSTFYHFYSVVMRPALQ